VLWLTVFIDGVRPVAATKAALIWVMPLTSLGSEWLLPILSTPVSWPAGVGAVVGAAVGPVVGAAVGAAVAAGAAVGVAAVELQAAMTVGSTVRPAAPMSPFLRTSRRLTCPPLRRPGF
jgi:hypothetical protein